MALPARRHRRRQQPDDPGHRRRRDVRDRFPRECLRRRRRRRASAVDMRRPSLGGDRREGYIFRNRGVCYADGVVYVAGGSFLFALDAKTGKPIPGFGKDGQASVILDVLKTRYPEAKTAISMGYWFTTAPQVYNGVLYIGSTRSESHIPGGHVFCRRRQDGQGPLALQHGSAGREGSGLGDRRSDVGRRRTQRRRHLGDTGHRSRAGTALRRGRQSVRRQPEARGHESLHRFDHRADARTPASWRGTISRRTTTSGTTTRAVRRSCSTCRCGERQGRSGGEQERLSLHPESRNRRTVSRREMPADGDIAQGERRPPSRFRSAHRENQIDSDAGSSEMEIPPECLTKFKLAFSSSCYYLQVNCDYCPENGQVGEPLRSLSFSSAHRPRK